MKFMQIQIMIYQTMKTAQTTFVMTRLFVNIKIKIKNKSIKLSLKIGPFDHKRKTGYGNSIKCCHMVYHFSQSSLFLY